MVEIYIAEEVRDLAVIANVELSFETHISMIVWKAFGALFSRFRSTSCNSPQTLIKLYKAYVVPILEYGSQNWSPATRKLQHKIEKIQQNFTRILK